MINIIENKPMYCCECDTQITEVILQDSFYGRHNYCPNKKCKNHTAEKFKAYYKN